MRLTRISLMMVWMVLGACQDDPPPFTEKELSQDESGSSGRESADGKPARGERWEETFDAHRLQDASLTIDVPNALVHETIVLTHTFASKTKTMRQINRVVGQDAYRQGHAGGVREEAFTQTGNKNLDILVVVDNSGSMAEEQRNLGARLTPLLSAVEETDWRIAVTTTDPSGPCVRAAVGKGDVNAETAFRKAVQAGTMGSGNERGVLTAVKALSASCQNFAGWMRDDSSLAVLILSDEDNCSDGTECRGEAHAKGDYLLDHLATMRVPGKNARVYGILWHPTEPRASCPTAQQPAPIYADLVARTGGSWGSICDNDYTGTLSAISQDMAVNLKTKFTLQQAPNAGSVAVTVDGVRRTDFTVSGNILELATPPRDGSIVKVSYGYGGEPMKTEFVLSRPAAPDSLVVMEDGVVLSPAHYALDATHTRLVFSTMPQENARIRVTYREDKALPATFTLEKRFKGDELVVTVDGRVESGIVSDSAAGTFRFLVPPSDGAEITAMFKMPVRPITRYPVAMPDHVSDTFVARDARDGAELNVRFENGAIVVPVADVVEGRALTLTYANPHRDQFRYTLPHAPLDGTLTVSDGVTTCGDALVVTGAEIFAGHCGFPWNVAEVGAHYRFIAVSFDTFTVHVPDLRETDTQNWTVLVDGRPFENFVRDGFTVKITHALPLESRVTVRVDY